MAPQHCWWETDLRTDDAYRQIFEQEAHLLKNLTLKKDLVPNSGMHTFNNACAVLNGNPLFLL